MSDVVIAVLVILAGGFTLLGGVLDWDWIMNSRRARMFVALFGRQGARIFYVILGVIIMLVGFVALIAGG